MKREPSTEVLIDYTLKVKRERPPVVFFPFIFQDVITVCDTLKSGVDVIVNLMHLKDKEKLRVLDFICGFSYALLIEKSRLEDGVYLFQVQQKTGL